MAARLLAGVSIVIVQMACAAKPAPPVRPPGPTPAAPLTDGHGLPRQWREREPAWVRSVQRLAPAAFGERWEQTAGGCEHVYLAGDTRGRVDGAFGELCSELGFGRVDVHVFKLPTKMVCRGERSLLRAEHPWSAVELVRVVQVPCTNIHPAWVAGEMKEVAPMIGDPPPIAAAYRRERSSSRTLMRWQLEWMTDAVDQKAIEDRLDSLGYMLSDQASYRLWTRRRPETHSYTFAKSGRYGERLIVGRWR